MIDLYDNKYLERTSMDNPSFGLPLVPDTPLPPALFPALSLPSVPASALRGILSARLVEAGKRGGFRRVGLFEGVVQVLGYLIERNISVWSNASRVKHPASSIRHS